MKLVIYDLYSLMSCFDDNYERRIVNYVRCENCGEWMFIQTGVEKRCKCGALITVLTEPQGIAFDTPYIFQIENCREAKWYAKEEAKA